ncbi:MAG TPA: hypothetical protein VIB38_07660 [Aestuariivirgaceae bacterium]
MSMQDVEPTTTEGDATPKRKSSRKRSRKSAKRRAGAGRNAQASRSTQTSRSTRASRGRRRSSRSSARRSKGAAERVAQQGRGVLNRAYSFAEEARRAMPRMPRMPRMPHMPRVARDLRLPRRSDFNALVDANPLVMGAIGLGLGVVLGTLMPQKLSGRLGNLAQFGSARSSSRRRRR